jgi:hypothetical protein
MRPIEEYHLSAKTKKRDADEQELQERFKKPRKVWSIYTAILTVLVLNKGKLRACPEPVVLLVKVQIKHST